MRRRGRLLGTGYLLAIFGATFVSGHRHLNPIADLLSDSPSDSGFFLRAAHPSAGGRPGLSGFVFVDDDPCLACFWHDFLAFTAARHSLHVTVSILPLSETRRRARFLSNPAEGAAIRGPPVPFA